MYSFRLYRIQYTILFSPLTRLQLKNSQFLEHLKMHNNFLRCWNRLLDPLRPLSGVNETKIRTITNYNLCFTSENSNKKFHRWTVKKNSFFFWQNPHTYTHGTVEVLTFTLPRHSECVQYHYEIRVESDLIKLYLTYRSSNILFFMHGRTRRWRNFNMS